MMNRETTTHSYEETQSYAEAFASQLCPGDTVAFFGDLGAGKTAFSGGVARGLGISCPVVSPTFTLVQEYPQGRIPLYHFDVYRLGGPDGLEDIGFYEYLGGDGICLIEWSELIESELPEYCYRVTITRLSENERKITITGGRA
ncbi:MAG: tRNA (adenosine(37)-N6)-threonylcarbamoyltransferase complex ATPase subunit type 1 TsaE [Clostridia bacterium]|nr:tRNA (adenosine(37)-N6)-threonylcarbamoyltransferase complex ATPase subunit type 1 TsaE [Clostridia bacterium]